MYYKCCRIVGDKSFFINSHIYGQKKKNFILLNGEANKEEIAKIGTIKVHKNVLIFTYFNSKSVCSV